MNIKQDLGLDENLLIISIFQKEKEKHNLLEKMGIFNLKLDAIFFNDLYYYPCLDKKQKKYYNVNRKDIKLEAFYGILK